MKTSIITLFFLLCAAGPQPGEVKVSSGRVVRHGSFPSSYVQPRNVDVWLPDGYKKGRRYAVLYMHDGQMLYDSTANWNKQEWQVDETASRLMKSGKTRDFIVVGIWNNGNFRHTEYFPEKPIALLPKEFRDSLVTTYLKGEPLADRYLKFLVKELKPFIDSTYSVYTGPENTFIAGSSMGGLISMYAICEYPEVFGGAACLSTHWPGVAPDGRSLIPKAFDAYMRQNLPSPQNHRIWFDYGTETLDRYYEPWQLLVDETMKAKGFDGTNWITRKFPGKDHSERAWSARLHLPLEFLLGKR